MRSFYSILAVFLLFQVAGCPQETRPLASKKQSNVTENSLDVKLRAHLNFGLTPEQISERCDTKMAEVTAALDKVATVTPKEATFSNTVKEIDLVMAEFTTGLEPATFLKYVSPDSAVRAAGDKCETAVGKLQVDISTRQDLYLVVKAAAEKRESLEPVEQRLLDDYLSDFIRNGLALSPEQRKRFIEKKKRLVELGTEFDKTLNEWSDPLAVTEEELDGMGADFIESLEKTPEGKRLLTLAYPHYYPAMQNLKNGDVRRRLQIKFFNRGGDSNTARLEEAIRLRHELAKMLDYDTHADFVLDKRMAKEPKAVMEFLASLKSKLKQKGQSDLAEFLTLKQEELGDPSLEKIESWDWRYYSNLLKKKKYKVDHEKIKEYFPLTVVVNGMLEIYETLLGVDFIELKEAPTWHESVKAFAVIDNVSSEVVSYFYMDLFPRDGKYKHAAAFTLLQGHEKRDGSYQIPVSSIVANFNPPTAGKPSLLLHSQVETLFHELGHIMHQVLTTAKYASYAGTSVKRDYVEAPSQMLENWVWNKEALLKLSGHYSDPSKKLPDELLDKLVAAKLANVGITYLRQIFFATLDMTYHTSESVESTAVYQELISEIMLLPIPEGTQPQASFGHLMGGYDAGYYGYLWSEVFAQDMFTRFDKEGLLNPAVGADYRQWILKPGGSQDPMELISGFIGRKPNDTAFLKSLGLQAAVGDGVN